MREALKRQVSIAPTISAEWRLVARPEAAEIKAGRLRAVKAGDHTLILHDDREAWARSLRQVTP